MTREEAIEVYNGLINEKIKAAFEFFSPELRESEDDRIRKVIYKLMLGMREEIFTSQDEIVTKEKVLAYLEKKPGIKIWPHPIKDAYLEQQGQKPAERKINEIIDAMNGEHEPGDIYSEDGRLIAKKDESEDERMVRKIESFLSAYGADYFSNDEWREIENWLEKQKENPKSADSIPEDCVSSAKCEDRWHKVGDSLPDNPREVLCKDEAGNYFIGRYYTEEGWEISNYDDEDKPHHLNPPVSKWIDFPSEKQKESLHISETCKENADSFTDEGERIRKALVWHLKADVDFVSNGVTKAECIAYLEKQKGPENISASTMVPSCWECEQKEQKPSIFPPGLGEVHWNPIPSGKDVHKWNLPEDFEEAVYKVANFISPFNSQEELRKVSHRFAEQLLDIAKKDLQKPAWSDVDEKMLKCCLIAINHYEKTCNIGDHLPTKFNIDGYLASVDKVKSWLKSIRPQPKQELSKEETKDLVHILKVLDDCYAYGKHDLSKTDHDNLTSTIKSLRPGWKPTEEQMNALNFAITFFMHETNYKNPTELRDLYDDLLKLK